MSDAGWINVDNFYKRGWKHFATEYVYNMGYSVAGEGRRDSAVAFRSAACIYFSPKIDLRKIEFTCFGPWS